MSMQVLIELQDAEGGRQRFTLTPGQYYMGKADTCAILLNDPHVSRHHATLEVSETDVILTDNNSTNGTWFENQRILNPILVQPGDMLRMGTMTLSVLEIQTQGGDGAVQSTALEGGAEGGADGVMAPTDEALVEDDAFADSPYSEQSKAAAEAAQYSTQDFDEPGYDTQNNDVGEGAPAESQGAESYTGTYGDDTAGAVAIDPGLGHAPMEAPAYYDASPATSSPQETANAAATEHPDDGLEEIWQSMTPEQQADFVRQSNAQAFEGNAPVVAGPAGGEDLGEAEQREARAKAEQMVQTMNPVFMEDMDDPEKAAFQQKVIATAQQMVARELERIDQEVRSRPATVETVPSEINAGHISFGELQPLIDDPAISRIMINGLNGLYVERQGRLEPLKYAFDGQEALDKLIFKMLAPLGYDLSKLDPVLDTYLPDGTHLNIVFAPIATDGPLITLQKAQTLVHDAAHFLQLGSCSEDILQFLQQCVAHNRNILVTGAAGAGKSACLNMLSHFAHPGERVVIVEDVPELGVNLPHAIRLQAGLARLKGVQGLSTQLLMNNVFSMRPDRIVLSEFYPNAALDMLMAMNNSSANFLTTFEAHSARDLMYRLELGMIMRKPELPVPIIRSQAAHAVNIIVTMAQFSDGSRKIAEVSEVFGIEEGRVGIQPVFRFLQGGLDDQGMVWGRYDATGYIPSFYRHKERVGEAMDKSIFQVEA